jgi:hypothetical protein
MTGPILLLADDGLVKPLHNVTCPHRNVHLSLVLSASQHYCTGYIGKTKKARHGGLLHTVFIQIMVFGLRPLLSHMDTSILEEQAATIFGNGVIRVRVLLLSHVNRGRWSLGTEGGDSRQPGVKGVSLIPGMYLSYFTVWRRVCVNQMIAWKLPVEWDVNVFKLYMSVNCYCGDSMVFDN